MQHAGVRQTFQKLASRRAVGDLAAGEHEGDGAAMPVGQGVDFGRAAAARPTDGLIFAPPFTTKAERCAFHCGRGDQPLLGRTSGTGERAREIAPDAFGRPADIPIIERLARSVVRRRVDLAPARFQHMNDAADHALAVNSAIRERRC